jgi:hypothetical protein
VNVLPAQAAVPAAAPGLGSAEPSGSVAREAWPLPPLAQLLSLGDARLTRLYWAGVGLLAAGFCVTQLLPCVDYPQHLALSDVARRLMVPGSPEHEQYDLNYFTYNGLFHILVARLSAFVPIELAGRSVVVLSVVATAGAVVALVRMLRRPPEYAALFTPILFSYSLVWGFVNYVLATAIAAWALVFVARFVVKPSVGAWLAVGALGALCAFAHVLAMLTLCLAGAALAIELSWRVGARPGARWPALRALVRAVVALAPLLVGCAYCIAVYKQQFPWDPNMYRDPTMEGMAPPLWQKLVYFSAFATNLFGDVTDQVVLWASILVMGIAVRVTIASRRAGTLQREPSPPIVAPFIALTVAYFATPMVLVGTHLIFPRLAQWSILGAILATPRYPLADAVARARRWVPRLGVLAGANAFIHCAVFAHETRDASATIDDLPAGGAATAVLWDPDTESFRNGPLTHMAAYYGARKHGRWAFAFARYLSVPVRFRPFTQPAWPEQGWEFDGEAYDPRCKYARAFPLVIIKAPDDLPLGADGETAIRKMIFHADAPAVKLLSHHGEYWAFDTQGLPTDGKF